MKTAYQTFLDNIYELGLPIAQRHVIYQLGLDLNNDAFSEGYNEAMKNHGK